MKIYYKHGKLKIRSMLEGDAQAIIEVFQSYGWNNKIETYLGYFKDQETGIRNVYIAEYDDKMLCEHLVKAGDIAGYLFRCLHCKKYHIYVDAC